MILSDNAIISYELSGCPLIEPFNSEHLQPASYDVHLYPEIAVPGRTGPFDPDHLEDIHWDMHEIPEDGLILWPSGFVLLCTDEVVLVPDDLCAMLDGSSTLSRSGLAIHQTGQWIDPGFHGQLTLEVKCNNQQGYKLRPHQKIGQLIFAQTLGKANNPYRGRYQGQRGPQPPKTHK